MRCRRVLSAAVLAALAVTGLAACQSKVGLAASVGDQRLSENDLNSYVQPAAKPYTDQNGQRTVPKVFALQTWLTYALVGTAIEATGGPPTSDERAAARAAVLGSSSIDSAEQSFAKRGYTTKLGDLVVDEYGEFLILVQRHIPGLSPTQAVSALQANRVSLPDLIRKVNAPVDVSARYGTWNAKQFQLDGQPGSGLPSFVTHHGSLASY